MPAKVEAGAPEISGQFGGNQDIVPTGAFYKVTQNLRNSGSDAYAVKVAFAASRSSSVYGNSDTIQPPALVLIPQIKF